MLTPARTKNKPRTKPINEGKKESLLRPLLIASRQQKSDRNSSSQRGKKVKAYQQWGKDRHEAGMGRYYSKIRFLLEFYLTLPSLDSAIAEETLLSLASLFHRTIMVPNELDIGNKLSLSQLNDENERRPFDSLPRAVQLDMAHDLLDLLRRIDLAYIDDRHPGFQFNRQFKEELASLLCLYKESDKPGVQSGWMKLLGKLKKHKYSTGGVATVDDLVEVCPFQDKLIIYIRGFHGGANGKAEAAKITSAPVKVLAELTEPKGWILSEEGK